LRAAGLNFDYFESPNVLLFRGSVERIDYLRRLRRKLGEKR